MILMETKDQGGAAFELNIVLQNELNMTRWDAKNRSTKFDVLVRVHNFVVLRENVQKNEKSVHM